MAYEFYIDGDLLPVTPGKIQAKVKNQNKTVNLINEGEANILKTPGLMELSFDARIPQTRYPFAVYEGGFRDAAYFIHKLENLKTRKTKFQFIISRVSPGGELLFETNIRVSLEDYSIREDAQEGLDIILSINLKEYREYGTKVVQVAQPVAKAPVPPRQEDTAPKKTVHAVVAGDCLWAIAQKYLGDGNRYMEVYTLNKATIDAGNKGTGNPSLTIYPGQELQMPD